MIAFKWRFASRSFSLSYPRHVSWGEPLLRPRLKGSVSPASTLPWVLVRAHHCGRTQVMAEKEAWKIAEEHGLDLVTIHPVFVIGPVLSTRTDATSVKMIAVSGGPKPGIPPECCRRNIIPGPDVAPVLTLKPLQPSTENPDIVPDTNVEPDPDCLLLGNGWQDVLEGTKAIPITSRYCDVRDVARAHILAAEVARAHGRYLVTHESTVPSKFVSDTLQVRRQSLRSCMRANI